MMKALFILSFVANVVLTIVSLAVLPEQIAMHFGADGMANGWGPNYVNALIMTGTEVLLFFSLYFAAPLTLMFPAKWINLPNKDYWLSPERLPETQARISRSMYRIGVAFFLFFFVIGLLTIQANRSDPVAIDLHTFYIAMGLLLGYLLWWTLRFYMAFRNPIRASARTPRASVKSCMKSNENGV